MRPDPKDYCVISAWPTVSPDGEDDRHGDGYWYYHSSAPISKLDFMQFGVEKFRIVENSKAQQYLSGLDYVLMRVPFMFWCDLSQDLFIADDLAGLAEFASDKSLRQPAVEVLEDLLEQQDLYDLCRALEAHLNLNDEDWELLPLEWEDDWERDKKAMMAEIRAHRAYSRCLSMGLVWLTVEPEGK